MYKGGKVPFYDLDICISELGISRQGTAVSQATTEALSDDDWKRVFVLVLIKTLSTWTVISCNFKTYVFADSFIVLSVQRFTFQKASNIISALKFKICLKNCLWSELHSIECKMITLLIVDYK